MSSFDRRSVSARFYVSVNVVVYNHSFTYHWYKDSVRVTLCGECPSYFACKRGRDIYLVKRALYDKKQHSLKLRSSLEKICLGDTVLNLCKRVDIVSDLLEEYPVLTEVILKELQVSLEPHYDFIPHKYILAYNTMVDDNTYGISDSSEDYTTDDYSVSTFYSNMGFWPSDSSDDFSDDLFVVNQSDEVDYKESCRQTFKIKAKRSKGKITKIVDNIKCTLTKGERKKLLASLRKLENQSGASDMVNAIIPFFDTFPFLKKVLIEVIRASVGIYMSTTKDQVKFHLMSSAVCLGLEYMPEIRDIMSNLFNFEQQSGDWGDMLKSTLEGWKGLANNPLILDIKKGVMLLVMLGFKGLTGVAEYFPSMKEMLSDKTLLGLAAFDIISYALELIVSLYSRCKAVVETQSLKSFFVSAPTLIAISNRYDSLVAKFPHALAGNLEEPEHVYQGELHSVHKRLVDLANSCSAADRVYVNRWKLDLARKIREYSFSIGNNPIRAAPYSLNLIGGSGVGKTGLVATFAVVLGKCYGTDIKATDLCFNDPNDKFFSTYRGQIGFIEDDKNANKAVPGVLNENDVTLRVVNNAVMPLNKAGVEDKGVYTMRAKFHIMTTNVADAQAHILSNEPAAVLRRSHHVVVEVKPEFCLEGTTMLDPKKCRGRPLEDNAWMFTVQEIKVFTRNMSGGAPWCWNTIKHRDKLMNRVDLHDLLMYITDTCASHIVQQENILAGFEDLLENTQLCEHMSGIHICRLCNNLPTPPTIYTFPSMGHTTTGTPTAPIVVNQSYAVDILCQVTRWLFLDRLIPMFLYIAMLCQPFTFSFILHFGLRDQPALAHALGIFVRFAEQKLVRANMIIYLMIWLPIYFFLPLLSFGILGNTFSTCLLFGHGCARTIQRLAVRHYYYIDTLGARGLIRHLVNIRTRRVLESQMFYTGVVTAVVGALTMYRLLNSKKYVSQGAQSSVPVINPWVKMYIPPDEVDIKRTTTTHSDLVNCVSNRLAHVLIRTRGSTKAIPGNMLPVKSGVWLAPAHFFFDSNGSPLLHDSMDIRLNDSDVGSSLFNVPIDRSLIRKVGVNKDLCIIFIAPTVGQMKDMTSFFSEKPQDCSATVVYRQMDGSLKDGDNKVRLHYTKTDRNMCESAYLYLSPFATFVGLCGSVQIADIKCPCIAAMHVAGETGKTHSMSIALVRSEIESAMTLLFDDPFTLQTGSMEMMDLTDGDSSKVITKELHSKSPFSHLAKGSVYYHGRLAERAKAVSSVINTVMSETVEEVFGEKNIFGNPSKLRSWIPYYEAVSNIVVPVFKDPILLRSAVTDHHTTLLCAIEKAGKMCAVPLDEVTVLSGLDGDHLMQHMDINTSSGYPFRKRKSNFLTPVEYPEDKLHHWHFEMNDWARERVEAVRSRCEQGLRPNCIFSANLKVEVKSLFKKDEFGEYQPKEALPRVFYASSFEFIFLMRQYFMPILSIIQSVAECEMSVGINVMGPEWGKLANSLLAVSSGILEADQKKFDQSITSDELIPRYRFMIDLAKKCGYSDKDLRIMSVLSGCVITPIIDFNSDLVTLYSIGMSGGFGTVQFNCLVNDGRFRMFFYHCIEQFSEFAKLVAEYDSPREAFTHLILLMFYGDDSIVAAKPEISKFYNMRTFADFMATQGIDVTSASKGEIEKDLLDITEVDYLKRGFRFDEERQVWTAPLNESSIMKRLMAMIPSSVLTHEEQCAEAIESSLRDYFEYGRDVFEDRKLKLTRVAERHKLFTYMKVGLPSYDNFVREYNEKWNVVSVPQPCGT